MYPVGRTEIEAALTAAGARVVRLYLSCSPGRGGRWPGTLLSARWHPHNTRLAERGPWLTVDAVPSGHRAAVAQMLRAELLQSVAEWMSRIDPDSAWAGRAREWEARLIGGRPIVSER